MLPLSRRAPPFLGSHPSDLMPETTPPNTLVPGADFGRYTIGRMLGAGGMGTVYEATHRDLRKRVAIKTLLPEMARDPGALARFMREGEAVARLRHPNVVDITDYGVEAGIPYLVMEFLEGEDLGAALYRDKVFVLSRAVDLLLPVFDAVAAAHEEGIVHRDLKPENIFLARTRHDPQEPRLLDFGISKVNDLGTSHALTATNTMMGTTVYMSPEQALNSKDVDGRTDQYALGVILYECATGTHPFAEIGARDSLFELLSAIIAGKFNPPRSIRPDLPSGFENVVLRAMASRRDDRYASVIAMAQDLLPFASPTVRDLWQARMQLRSGTNRSVPPVVSPVVSPAYLTSPPTLVPRPAAPPPGDTVSPQISTVAQPVAHPARRVRRAMAFGGAVLVVIVVGIVSAVALRGGPSRPTTAAVPVSAVPRPTLVPVAPRIPVPVARVPSGVPAVVAPVPAPVSPPVLLPTGAPAAAAVAPPEPRPSTERHPSSHRHHRGFDAPEPVSNAPAARTAPAGEIHW